jgi:hypothetical protein
MEIWKSVPNYKGIYEVSNLGKLKNIKRNRIINGGINKEGYIIVVLHDNKVRKTFALHQLVAICFLNHVPNGLSIIVDHIDNNKLNNCVDNLQLISQRINSSKDRKEKSSNYTGVSFYKPLNKWRAYIYINSKIKHLGYFDTELEAHEAYQKTLKTI